ncbi:hypothetical protein T10_2950 [Trichinella papuae]|uniref:Uncharacterized protein n=1 Tax=Trichinella papuae TaxID=268474 RepID=A0A0V1MVR8_9BILA|nr:hypothetical protein T10_2950 [Trichinella papuae]
MKRENKQTNNDYQPSSFISNVNERCGLGQVTHCVKLDHLFTQLLVGKWNFSQPAVWLFPFYLH